MSNKIKARVVIEIEIDDVLRKYPNFIFNYEDEKDFLIRKISELEYNTSLEECEVFKNLHPAFENPEYDYAENDFGYKQTVKKFEII